MGPVTSCGYQTSSERLREANPAEPGLLGEVESVAPGICGAAFSGGRGWCFPTQILMVCLRHLNEKMMLFSHWRWFEMAKP